MQFKLPDPDWLPLIEACDRLGITLLRALQYASEGLLQLHAFSSHPDFAGTYERLQHGSWFADLWNTSTPVVVEPESATELIHDDQVLLDEWMTRDGERWSGRHEVCAYTLAVYRKDLVVFRTDIESFETKHRSLERDPGNRPDTSSQEMDGASELGQRTESEIETDVLKKKALVEKYSRVWAGIESDFNHSNENGLSDAAKAKKRGYWYELKAVDWARKNGKIPTASAPMNEFPPTSLRGKIYRSR